MGSDLLLLIYCFFYIIISIHTPRMGSDAAQSGRLTVTELFQSTLPAWGVTRLDWRKHRTRQDFNPHSPHGE